MLASRTTQIMLHDTVAMLPLKSKRVLVSNRLRNDSERYAAVSLIGRNTTESVQWSRMPD